MFDLQQTSATSQEFFTTTATTLARATKFVQRESKLTGAGFAQTLVFGFLDEPAATLNDLAQTSAELGISISPQGLDERLTPQAVEFLKQMFQQSLASFRNTVPLDLAFLAPFPAVQITDSTVVALPESLRDEYPGCGGDGPAAALKVQLVFDYLRGNLEVVEWQPGRTPDQNYTGYLAAGPAGALHLHDLGYFKLKALQQTADSSYFFSRLLTSTALYDPQGTAVDLLDLVRTASPGAGEQEIQLGAAERIPCRLLYVPVPEAVVNERRRTRAQYARAGGPGHGQAQGAHALPAAPGLAGVEFLCHERAGHHAHHPPSAHPGEPALADRADLQALEKLRPPGAGGGAAAGAGVERALRQDDRDRDHPVSHRPAAAHPAGRVEPGQSAASLSTAGPGLGAEPGRPPATGAGARRCGDPDAPVRAEGEAPETHHHLSAATCRAQCSLA